MSFKPCYRCGKKFLPKASTVYWSYMRRDDRESYVLKLCPDCVQTWLAPFVRHSIDNPDGETCAACHEQVEDNQGLQFLTIYLPKREGEQYTVSLCDSHSEAIRMDVDEWGMPATRRELGSSQGPVNQQAGVWAVPW